MTGVGRSCGAVTVVNAMPCGIGATIGTALVTEARFSAAGKGEGRRVRIVNDPGEPTVMAELCVSAAFGAAGAEEPEDWVLDIVSEIPVSRGLKSSSSACNAIISAVTDECGFHMDPEDAVRLGIGCAKQAKVTVTGSFDDACGCHLGGFVMTDNRTDELLVREDFPEFDVVVHVPSEKIRKTSLDVAALKAASEEMEAIVRIARRDPLEAMTLNGRLISRISGVDNSVADRAMEHGALAAGVSGSGPAVAIILEHGTADGFLADAGMPGDIIVTHTRRSIS